MKITVNRTAAATASDMTMLYGIPGGGFKVGPTSLQIGPNFLSSMEIGKRMKSVLELIEELQPKYKAEATRRAYSDEPKNSIEEDFIARKSDEIFVITTKRGGRVQNKRILVLKQGELRVATDYIM